MKDILTSATHICNVIEYGFADVKKYTARVHNHYEKEAIKVQ